MNGIVRERRNDNATIIQKFIRGYKVRLSTLEIQKEIHLVMNFDFFDRMKIKMHSDSQVLIAYHWRKYYRRTRRPPLRAKGGKSNVRARKGSNKDYGAKDAKTVQSQKTM